MMNPENIRYIVVHCSATRCNASYPAWLLESDHIKRGYKCAGYHYYIGRNGSIVPMRPLSIPGAHVRGYNYCSIGVCYEGGLAADGYPCDTRTASQKRSLERLLRQLKARYPLAMVVGHRDLSPDRNGDGKVSSYEWLKACPCFDAVKEYAQL